MIDNKHLTDEELIQHVIDASSLAKDTLNHVQQCKHCQGQNEPFLREMERAEKAISPTQITHDQARRVFWNQTLKKPNNILRNMRRLVAITTICVTVSFLFLPLKNQSPHESYTSIKQDERGLEEKSLLQFATALTPNTTPAEPDFISFIVPEEPEEYESQNDQFSDFVLFISTTNQEQSPSTNRRTS